MILEIIFISLFIVYLLSFLVVDIINTKRKKNAYANIGIDESFTIRYNMHLKNKEGDFFLISY